MGHGVMHTLMSNMYLLVNSICFRIAFYVLIVSAWSEVYCHINVDFRIINAAVASFRFVRLSLSCSHL